MDNWQETSTSGREWRRDIFVNNLYDMQIDKLTIECDGAFYSIALNLGYVELTFRSIEELDDHISAVKELRSKLEEIS